MLVTAGNADGFNTMTASWGFAGIMWGKPCAVTVIRPQRYTKEFIDREETFTLSFYPEECRQALGICGSKSGRDTDKCAATGLVPVEADGSVAFEQAKLVFVCRKLYAAPLEAGGFIDTSLIQSMYSGEDYHTAYIGEIAAVYKK
ncbi:MAG: flavin reductase [Ruminococcus sp.]|nr:flavin reductase [Ruminococcus sp.]